KGDDLMIGCMILGGLAAIGLTKLFHYRRYGGGWGCGRRWRHHHFHGHGHGPWGGGHGVDDGYGPDFGDTGRGGGGGGYRMPFVLRCLSDRLEATPAQERAMGAALEEFRAEVAGLKGEAPKTREDVADALRRPAFDEVLLGELFARHDGSIEKV